MEQPQNSMWIRAFTPDGYQVSFTLNLPEQDPIGFAALVVEELTKHNFNPRESSLEPGEQLVTVNQVLRREHVNAKSGEITPVVEFWHNSSKYRTVQYYLNTAEDIQALALATGIGLDNFPLYEGEGSVERGKSPKAEAKITDIQPIQIVMKTVEKEVDGAVQKRKYFVHFHSKGIPAPEFMPEPKPSTQEVQEKLGSGKTRRINTDESTNGSQFVAVKVVVGKEDKNQYIDVYDNRNHKIARAWTRQLFRDAGYNADEWSTPGTAYEVLPFARCTVETNKRGYPEIVKVEPLEV